MTENNPKPRIVTIVTPMNKDYPKDTAYMWVDEEANDNEYHSYRIDRIHISEELIDEFSDFLIKFKDYNTIAIKNCKWYTDNKKNIIKDRVRNTKEQLRYAKGFYTVAILDNMDDVQIVKNPQGLLNGLLAMEVQKPFDDFNTMRQKSTHWDEEELAMLEFLNPNKTYSNGDIGPESTPEEIEEFFNDNEVEEMNDTDRESNEEDTSIVETVDIQIEQAETKQKTAQIAKIKKEPLGLTQDNFADKIALTIQNIREMCMPQGSTEKEAKQFFAFCQMYRLNPFISELSWRSTGNGKGTVQIHYNAILKIANRNPNYDGFEHGVIVETARGEERQVQGNRAPKGTKLIGGWAKVYRKDRRVPVTKMVSFEDYRPKYANWTKTLWFKLPGTMITKVASAQAHREAFPEDLSGMYEGSELDQAGN